VLGGSQDGLEGGLQAPRSTRVKLQRLFDSLRQPPDRYAMASPPMTPQIAAIILERKRIPEEIGEGALRSRFSGFFASKWLPES